MADPKQQDTNLLERIKLLAIQGMFLDDALLEQLVLKGGNAMALVHRVSARASVDLDFSMRQDFSEGFDKVAERIKKTLLDTFRDGGFELFDFKMIEKPTAISDDMKHFWGGYGVEFKLVSADVHTQFSGNIEELRKRAINLGQGTKFLIDISRFEFVDDKQEREIDGTVIFVYSPEMIVCEKLRAICQQLPEYGEVVKRGRAGSQRARDFIDIFVLVNGLHIDLQTERNQKILQAMFEAKKVPLSFLGQIEKTYDFHAAGADSVKDTVAADFDLQEFRHYFDYVVSLTEGLKPLWNE
ncbi:nucleotidyl transferase AbiEii/AbiGii toxin family protein [Ralstonia sp. CHL-2022]|uniref:Nucleotidyl transferase AbiEii/AbiGii toxin family protein n=1 Tax=Ralstonia mojiangensis TaxID=2953895 RepID=A0AAE3I483_9RALS|nr:nucleotidyl transferase AbiEii/AbiGii toxin family protein [Ralstonia mojiangensis]MCT7317409.1 nucleotidyl transferase AbiEii/AbiGii toxin family protein [Ralstonia mojiangensis]